MSPRSTVDPVDDHIIHLSIDLAIPPEEAFTHFTENLLLERWLTARANVEPRVGGSYELFWNPDDPENDSTIGCRITSLVAGEHLSFQWRSPRQFKGFANGADPLTHVVVSFHPRGSGSRVNLVHSGWRSDPEWEEARRWQEAAWSDALATLVGME